jgi:hypothetical protein
MSYRLAAAAFGSLVAGTLVLAGCSSGGSGSAAGAKAPAMTSAGTPGTASPVATSAATVAPAATGSRSSKSAATGITVTVSGLPDQPTLAIGGSPLQFTVNITNGTSHSYDDVTPVIAMAHCTCSSSPIGRAPAGTLQEFSFVTGKWRTVDYNTVGSDKAYLNVVEQSPVELNPGSTVSFTFRVKFSAAARQPNQVHAGQAGLLVTVVQHHSSGSRPVLASVQVAVPVDAG